MNLGSGTVPGSRAEHRAGLFISGLPGEQVICIDNFFTGSKENIAHLLGKTNFELIRHDVVEKILLEVDQIFHLACPASPIHYKCASACYG